MKVSNLLLDNYVINELNYSLINNSDKGKSDTFETPLLAVKCSYEQISNKKNKRKCGIEISLAEKSNTNFPYQFKIVMTGLFTINTEIDAETGERLFRVNAPALLYSAAREIIFNLTSHSEHAPFLLPSVTFLDEAEPVINNSGTQEKQTTS
jgi:preprotein translocase subunit SecB